MFTFFSFIGSYLYVSSVCTVPTRQICCFDLQREGKKPAIGKRYFAGTLEEMIMDYHQKQMSIAERNKDLEARKVFADFLRGLIECDPNKRWTPSQAAQHPFLTGEQFDGPFKPLPEKSHMVMLSFFIALCIALKV
jgi:dual specificity protein kinase YAK1